MCDDIERRNQWRETDGFAKAGEMVGKSFHERMQESVVLGQANTLIVQRRSPLFVSMALGFHTQLDYQPVPYPAQREICEQMVKLGLLRHDPVDGAQFMHYVPVQEALRIYVEALYGDRKSVV